MYILRLLLAFSLFLNFSLDAYARGAGVCPVFSDGSVLLGAETRTYMHGPLRGQKSTVLSDFGGKQDRGETLAQTAYREFIEETGHYTFGANSPYKITLKHVLDAQAKGHFADHIHPQSGLTYRTYFVRIHGKKPDINTIKQNAALAVKRLKHKAHVEKTEWKYSNAQDLKNAPWKNGRLPGTSVPLFRPFQAVIKQASAQNFLRTVVPLPTVVQPQLAPKPSKVQLTARKPLVQAQAPKSSKVQPAARKPLVRAQAPKPLKAQPAARKPLVRPIPPKISLKQNPVRPLPFKVLQPIVIRIRR